jgi:hypothetical protein
MEMIPLQEDHDSTTLIGSDRVLWISGSLAGTNFTHAASALYDGQNLYPYLVVSTVSGDSGSISSFFHSFSTFSFGTQSRLIHGSPLVHVTHDIHRVSRRRRGYSHLDSLGCRDRFLTGTHRHPLGSVRKTR